MKSNFLQRTVTGVLFVIILVGCILYSPLSFGILFTLIAALSVYEFSRLMNQSGKVKVNALVGAIGGGYLVMAFMGRSEIGIEIFLPYLVLILSLIIAELYLKHDNPIGNWACTLLGQVYVALPFALLRTLTHLPEPLWEGGDVWVPVYNPILPLSIFVFIWLNDTGAYCVGSLLGKHRLFERISPKKSWEGSIGGGILAIASSLLFARFEPFMSTWQWAGLALVVVVFGTFGDLTESLFKRQLGIKDSGKILPGHGGMLDRFDSALLAIPAAVVYLYFLV
ncbi:MAG: phosphatidate cytidylyltransferase [Prevotellaceae bacterium]|jgi:phosphatidate cytidylyltransferase|nr:phosphatidate cytidylyltransferase [Prevotellaceae bacterium]